MNKDKVGAICHKVSTETGLAFNSIMTYYFLESILLLIDKITTLEDASKIRALSTGSFDGRYKR